MSVASTRIVTIAQVGDGLNNSLVFPAASNALAAGAIDIFTLSGSTVIAFPTGGSQTQGATIIPPSGNTNTITVKGTTADVGIVIHKTDPTSLAFDTTTTTQTSIVITVNATTTGLRIVWT